MAVYCNEIDPYAAQWLRNLIEKQGVNEMTLYVEKYQLKNNKKLAGLLRRGGADKYVKKYLAKGQ